MNSQDALKLIEISANLAAQTIQTRTSNIPSNTNTETELKNIFIACVDMVCEKFLALPIAEQEANEKFATIGEMQRIFSEKFVEIDHKEEKFATIAEMHRVFAEKFVEIDRKFAALPFPRKTRRPV
jgi:hypothetical protein